MQLHGSARARRYYDMSLAISHTQEFLQSVGVDFRPPDYRRIDLARPRRMEIKSVVKRDLAVGNCVID